VGKEGLEHLRKDSQTRQLSEKRRDNNNIIIIERDSER